MWRAEDFFGAGFLLAGVALATWVGPLSAVGCGIVGLGLIVAGYLRRQSEETEKQGGSILARPDRASAALGIPFERRIEIKNHLGSLQEAGENACRIGDKGQAERWVTEAHKFIEEVFGSGEAKLFLSDAGYVFFSGAGHVKNWLDGRLRRLASLIERADSLPIR